LFIPSIAEKTHHAETEGMRWVGWFLFALAPLSVVIALARTPERVVEPRRAVPPRGLRRPARPRQCAAHPGGRLLRHYGPRLDGRPLPLLLPRLPPAQPDGVQPAAGPLHRRGP